MASKEFIINFSLHSRPEGKRAIAPSAKIAFYRLLIGLFLGCRARWGFFMVGVFFDFLIIGIGLNLIMFEILVNLSRVGINTIQRDFRGLGSVYC